MVEVVATKDRRNRVAGSGCHDAACVRLVRCYALNKRMLKERGVP